MKFDKLHFSRRFPDIEAAVMVYHEMPPSVPKGIPVPPHYRSTAAALILPSGRFWIGISTCSPEDVFSNKRQKGFLKSKGKDKAVGRAIQDYLVNAPIGLLDLTSQTYLKELIDMMKAEISIHQKEIITAHRMLIGQTP